MTQFDMLDDPDEAPWKKSAVIATLVTTVVGVGSVALGANYLANYGWGLFVALPVCLGLCSTLIFSYSAPRTLSQCLWVSIAPMAVIALGLLVLAIEGAICILMAAPIGLGLAALGGYVGYALQACRWGAKGQTTLLSVTMLLVPLTMGWEAKVESQPPVLVVRSSLEINAPREVVWQKVIAFSEISEEREWLFRTGIAYPIRARLQGQGVGAVRRCEFSTGAFVEPIEVWDEPKLLRFSVTQNPAPMKELTPYGHIETAHLNGYFVSQEGQFELTSLPGGRTRLTGTTWYTDRIWPSAYWQIWSDYILHRIHMRVLQHIKLEAERVGAAA
jgi:hypothetical protein